MLNFFAYSFDCTEIIACAKNNIVPKTQQSLALSLTLRSFFPKFTKISIQSIFLLKLLTENVNYEIGKILNNFFNIILTSVYAIDLFAYVYVKFLHTCLKMLLYKVYLFLPKNINDFAILILNFGCFSISINLSLSIQSFKISIS